MSFSAEFTRLAEKELADVQTYLDILALRIGVDLGMATMNKFNEVSNRVGADVYMVVNEDREACLKVDGITTPV